VKAISEQLRLVLGRGVRRPDGVDDPARLEAASGGGDGFAGRQPVRKPTLAQLLALRQDLRTASAMDGPVNPAATHQGVVGCVDDGIDVLLGDIAELGTAMLGAS